MEFVLQTPDPAGNVQAIPDFIRKNQPSSIKTERDEAIRRVFTGEPDKFLLIIGPHAPLMRRAPVMEYIHRSGKGSEEGCR